MAPASLKRIPTNVHNLHIDTVPKRDVTQHGQLHARFIQTCANIDETFKGRENKVNAIRRVDDDVTKLRHSEPF